MTGGTVDGVRTAIADAIVFDGTGGPAVRGDVVLSGSVIEGIVEPGSGSADQVIDGSGLAVAPGFIDVHTHDDFAAMVHPDMAFKNRGGVTTCIVGNCGFSAAPQDPRSAFASSLHPGHTIPEFGTFTGYMRYLDDNPPGVNIGVLAGHGSIRAAVLGSAAFDPDHEPSDVELSGMADVVAEALEAGVLGLSSGLVYEPGKFATTDELVALASTMAGTGALYASHIRDEGDHLLQAVDEAVEIGRRAGVAVQISHHKAAGSANWGKVTDSLALIEAAQASGLTVHADQYPYTAGSTTLESVLSNYTIVEDRRDVVVAPGFDGDRGVDGPPIDGATLPGRALVVASCDGHPEWEGRSMTDLAGGFGLTAADTARRVLDLAPTTTVILHMMDEADVRAVLAHPSTVVGSDGLPTIGGRPHPRLYNTFARVLGRYARDLGVLPMAEAVARMTGRSADIFGLIDRGYIRPGRPADIVVFDPAAIIDRGTFAEPNRYPDGIVHVLVNGVPVVADGKPTGARPGRVLRRPAASSSQAAV